ncbi:MAG: Crp/Fnr family transcriptional regulator [Verrucomicrobiaceae bacterium]|nr:MAG: Crp/Fnr family transcriptional regulator [Verrucomicrobiaceae bacterium]
MNSQLPGTPLPAIAANRFFAFLPESRQETLAAETHLRQFAKGEVLYHENEPAEHVWVVVRGQVKLVKITRKGQELVIELVVAQELFGAVYYAGHPTYPTTAVALEETVVLLLPVAVMHRLLEESPRFQKEILADMCRRLCHAQEMRGLALEEVPRRLSWALLYLHGKFGPDIPHNRQTLAELAGTTVETAIRFTRRLSRDGIITTRRGRITVLAPERLEEFSPHGCSAKCG